MNSFSRETTAQFLNTTAMNTTAMNTTAKNVTPQKIKQEKNIFFLFCFEFLKPIKL
jgi:hypothetical protein